MEQAHWLPLGDDALRAEFARNLLVRGQPEHSRRERDLILKVCPPGSFQAGEAPRLPGSPTRHLGNIVHALYRRAEDGEFLPDDSAALEAGWDEEVERAEAKMRQMWLERSFVPLARHFRETPHILRFIEFMPVGETNRWRTDEVVSAAEIVEAINAVWPVQPVDPTYVGEVAARYRYLDGAGEVGVITSITQPFCGTCTRARLSAKGELYTCLFSNLGHDLRALLRGGASDDEIEKRITGIWRRRTDRYSAQRTTATLGLPKVEMSYIGG